ncbi:hypothetical protein [Salinivibrio sp. HTSP]|uniref:hypothetical protein n=1 Tax=Salinivibrio sp. HTSP TaxID=2115977 RepID=UPI000E3126B1|nr:hypothetical protein [Salinivibrio sp. HTSP]
MDRSRLYHRRENWDLAIGYVYYLDREERWELTVFDAGIIDMSQIPQGIEAFLFMDSGPS